MYSKTGRARIFEFQPCLPEAPSSKQLAMIDFLKVKLLWYSDDNNHIKMIYN